MTDGAQASSFVIKQYEPQSRFESMRRMAPFSTMSSPMDDPGHYVLLNTSLSTFSNSDAVSEGEIAISRAEIVISRAEIVISLAGARGAGRGEPS